MRARFSNSDAGITNGWPAENRVIEAEWFQLTYESLRIAPEGDFIATYQADGAWMLHDTGSQYSDVTIYGGDS